MALTKDEWDGIAAAAKLLGLEDRASLKEIKQAYRRMSKKHHPDLVGNAEGCGAVDMHEIIAAYELLFAYCKGYRFPMSPGENEDMAAEDWWMDRFGHDPLWGKG